MFKELEFVLKYISQQIEAHQLIQLYRELAPLYDLARTTPSDEVTQNINNTKEKIKEAQESAQPKDWDVIKVKLYKDFGADEFLGRLGISRLEQHLTQTANDPGGSSQKIKNLADEIEALKQRAEQGIRSVESLLNATEKT